MASKRCDNFEYEVEDDLELIEIFDDLKPPTNSPAPSQSKVQVAWGTESDTSVEIKLNLSVKSDVSQSDSDISIFSLKKKPKNHHPILYKVGQSDSDTSITSPGEIPRYLPEDFRLHLSDLEEDEPVNCPIESESDISMYSWTEKPKIKPRVFVPKLDLSGLVTPRDSGVVSVVSPEIHCAPKRKLPSLRKFFSNVCNFFTKCVKC